MDEAKRFQGEDGHPSRFSTGEGGLEEEAGEQMQVIGLQVNGEHFVVNILNVHEIVRFGEHEITRVPDSHEYILGVINLRGKVVPVVDLGTRLGLGRERDRRMRMVMVEIGDGLVGFAVDAVSEVMLLPENEIEPAISGEEYAVGITTLNGQIATLLDLEKTLLAPGDEERTGNAATLRSER